MKRRFLARPFAAVRRLFAEARRRRVIHTTVAYSGLFFVVAQAASIFFPALRLPDWSVTLVVALGLLGLPVVMTLAWVFDLGRGGITRTTSAGAAVGESPQSRWASAQVLFEEALELPPEEWAEFLDREAGGDRRMRSEIESLLRAHAEAGPLDRLGADVMGPLLAGRATPEASQGGAPVGEGERNVDGTTERYEVLEKLGDGGMGVVYRGRDTRLERDVALKFLPPHLSAGETARKRFLAEARAAAALDHPNICTIHEIGERPDGGLFIAMPLYDGETLDRRLVRGPLHWEEAVDATRQVAEGLARAHEARIIHRDIKPANLCITGEGVVKILDFGIAKVADAALTGAGRIVGTAAYMSPEQARGDAVDHRTDLWSLGVVLYEMLTGDRLFRGEGQDAVLAAIRSSEPLPLGRLGGTAPTPVIRVVEQMLSRRPADRPPTARAIIDQLKEAVTTATHDPVEEASNTADLPPEGERRQATVVALLVAGYSRLVEQVAPADLTARLARLRTAMDGIARRHGGTLNEFSDDGAVAVFGVPVTHEDDVLRAVRAVRELQDLTRLGAHAPGDEPFELRCGIATGTLVAQTADGGERAYRLAGEPPRCATQLAAQARPGEVLLDGPSARRASDRFTLTASGTLPPRGDDDEVTIFRLDGPSRDATRPPTTATHLTAYTGRDRELETLQSQFDRARAGEGQVVTIVGEAGAGKSRLVHEFLGRAGAGRIVRGHCESYAANRPYLPFVQVIGGILGLDGEGQGSLREGDVLEAVRQVDPHLERFAPFYLHLLSVPTDAHRLSRHLHGEQFRAAMREALSALITLASEGTPMILVLEDWHWVDEASSEVLKQLTEVLATYPLLVLVTYRPDDGADWESAQPRTLIQLAPLGVADSARMVAAMLDVPDAPAEVATILNERAGGNPFFLEELCQSLQEAGMLRVEDGRASLSGTDQTLHLPSTIQGVIRTRLDRLPPRTREVLRSAAVLGRDFALPLLERLGHDRYALDQALNRLKQLGIVQQTRVVPEPAFRFKHALTQEVAYDTLLLHQRKMAHRRAGEAIEALYGDRLAEQAARLAHHFSRADMWLKAVEYGRSAATRAQELSEFSDALATLESVAEWLERLPADEERRELEVETLLQQEEICETLGERGRQQQLLDRVIERIDADSDPLRRTEVYRRQGDVYTLLRRFPEARQALDSALALARESGDQEAQGHVLRSLGLTCWHGGQLDEALEHIEEALRIDRARGDEEATIADLTNQAQVLKDQGAYPEALGALDAALVLLDRVPNDLKKSYVLHTMANVQRLLGDSDEALDCLRRADEHAQRRHLPIQRSFHLTAIAHIRLAQGAIEDAIQTYQEAVAVARRARYAEGLAQSLRPLGELLAGVGREREALAYLEEAADLFGQLGNRAGEAEVWRCAAEAAVRAGSHRQAREAWTRHLALSRDANDTDGQLAALEGIARASREIESDPAIARSTLVDALGLARQSAVREREAGVLNSLGILDFERGDLEAALESYEGALVLYRDLGDTVRAGFILNSLGATLKALRRFDEGQARLEEALETNRASGQRLLEGHSLAILGEIFLETGKPDRAAICFETSLSIRRTLGDRAGEAWMSHYLALALSRQGLDGEARSHASTARRLAGELEDRELLAACDETRVGTGT